MRRVTWGPSLARAAASSARTFASWRRGRGAVYVFTHTHTHTHTHNTYLVHPSIHSQHVFGPSVHSFTHVFGPSVHSFTHAFGPSVHSFTHAFGPSVHSRPGPIVYSHTHKHVFARLTAQVRYEHAALHGQLSVVRGRTDERELRRVYKPFGVLPDRRGPPATRADPYTRASLSAAKGAQHIVHGAGVYDTLEDALRDAGRSVAFHRWCEGKSQSILFTRRVFSRLKALTEGGGGKRVLFHWL